MDELELSGRRHISAKRAAKEHRYHSDYIGQLIRSGKVVGQKVGRSWYVDAASLDAYLKGEKQPQAAVEVLTPVVSPTPIAAPVEIPVVVQEVQQTPAPVPVEPLPQKEIQAKEIERVVPIARAEIKPTYVEPVQSVPVSAIIEPVSAGLRFVPDEEPLASMHTMQDAMPEEESVVYVEPVRRRGGAPWGIAAAGVCTFVFVLASSYALVHRTVVAGEQSSAAVSLSLD